MKTLHIRGFRGVQITNLYDMATCEIRFVSDV
jgi:hypothetical protein